MTERPARAAASATAQPPYVPPSTSRSASPSTGRAPPIGTVATRCLALLQQGIDLALDLGGGVLDTLLAVTRGGELGVHYLAHVGPDAGHVHRHHLLLGEGLDEPLGVGAGIRLGEVLGVVLTEVHERARVDVLLLEVIH